MSQATNSPQSSGILPSTNPIPDKLINAALYLGADEQLGIGTVTLPELSYVTEAMEGLGLAGPVETPVIGHFQSLTLGITFNTVTSSGASLLKTQARQITVRASIQEYDAGTGTLVPRAVKLTANTLPKKMGLGKPAPGKKMDSEIELEVMYLKLWIGGAEVLEIDKLNFICRILGEDMLTSVRQHLGKAD